MLVALLILQVGFGDIFEPTNTAQLEELPDIRMVGGNMISIIPSLDRGLVILRVNA